AGRQQMRLPGTGRRLDAVELLEHRGKSFHTARPLLGIHALPAEQEAHVLREGDRPDLRAQPIQRVAMDTGEQPAIAPLEHVALRRAAAVQYTPLRLERELRAFDDAFVEGEQRCQCRYRDRATDLGA